jgi:hypothetical protein
MIVAVLAAMASAAEPAWKPVVDNGDYRWCEEPGAQAQSSRDWCELLDDAPPDVCPGLRKTCEGATPTTDVRDVYDEIRSGCNGDSPSGFAPPPEPPQRSGCTTEDPKDPGCLGAAGAAGAAVQWGVAILIALFVLLILRLLWQWFGTRLDRPLKTPEGAATIAIQPIEDVPDLPSDDLLAAARAAMARGRYGEAVMLARGAALRRLGEVGRLSLHRARTDREYVRQLRQDADLRDGLRRIVDAAEVHRWGGHPVTSELAESALDAATRVLATVSAAGLLWVLATEDAHAGRYDAYGDAALFDAFERGGYTTSWRLRGVQSLDATTDVLVLDLWQVDLAAEDRDAVRAWVQAGGVLIVGGDATTMFPELGTYVTNVEAAGDTDDDAAPAGFEVCRDVAAGPDAPPGLALPRWPAGPNAAFETPLVAVHAWAVCLAGGSTLTPVEAMSSGNGGVIAVADARLLRNGALLSRRNEAFLLEAPYAAMDAGIWSLPLPADLELATRGGTDADNPWSTLQNARLLPLVGQLFLLGSIVALWRGWPFGPLKEPPDEGRIAFADHVRALGTRYARLGASRRASAVYAGMWLQRLGPQGLEAAARRGGMAAPEAGDWVREIERLAADPRAPNAPGDLNRMEELWRITSKL